MFVGDINVKCSEDKLRILRYCRFCSIFQYPYIPKEYKQFIIRNKYLLKNIPPKKIKYELQKIFLNDYSSNSIFLLNLFKIEKTFFRKIFKNDKSFLKIIEKNLTFKQLDI